MFRFEHPQHLWALLAVPLLAAVWIGARRWAKEKIGSAGEPHLVARLIPAASPRRSFWRMALSLFAASLLAVSWAAPQRRTAITEAAPAGADVIIALDVSRSMTARDAPPDRLAVAHRLVTRLLESSATFRAGLILFAGRAYLQVPLTTDRAALLMMLPSATPEAVGVQGTAIGPAINLAAASFSEKELRSRVLILLTDGEGHDGAAGLDAAKAAGEAGIVIHAVGVGSPAGTQLLEEGNPKLDADGNPVVSVLDEEGLRAIAEATGGTYRHLRRAEETATALAPLLEQRGTPGEGAKATAIGWQHLAFPLLGTAAACLILPLVFPLRKPAAR